MENHATIALTVRSVAPNIWVIQPRLPFALVRADQHNILRYLLDELRYERDIHEYVLWYDTALQLLSWEDAIHVLMNPELAGVVPLAEVSDTPMLQSEWHTAVSSHSA